MSTTKGFLISIEGIDGSGKTTQGPLVVKSLLEKGYKAQYTQEPTREKIGMLLREYLRDPSSIPEVDALLFAADRVEHYWTMMKPMIEKGFIIITDRYVTSSIAYQGSMGVDLDWIRTINREVPFPDHTFYLEIDINTALDRLLSASRHTVEKFEKKEQMKNVKKIYDAIKTRENTHIIDATQTVDEITKLITQEIIGIISGTNS